MYLVILILTLAVLVDFAAGRVPNSISCLGFVVSQTWVLVGYGVKDAVISLIGVIAIIIVLYPLFAIGALGGGDIKLLLFLPGFFESKECFRIIFVSFVLAAIVGTIKLVSSNLLLSRIRFFMNYLKQINSTGRIEIYDNHSLLRDTHIASYQIHFTLYICISVAMEIGGLFHL